jgi:hypothetical protein
LSIASHSRTGRRAQTRSPQLQKYFPPAFSIASRIPPTATPQAESPRLLT